MFQFLRKLGLCVYRAPTREERDEADIENVLRDNEKAFKDATRIFKDQAMRATNKLARAVERARGSAENNPFGDLEALISMHRDRGKGRDYGTDTKHPST